MFGNVITTSNFKRSASILLVVIVIILSISMFPTTRVLAATVPKCDPISADETWTADNVYLLICDLTIENGVTVTIQAGTVIKFVDMYTDFYVNGVLDLQGTDTNRVVFTSYKDDLNGGDTNNDGNETSPAPGDWGTIFIYNNGNTLDYALVQYGGGYYGYGGIYVDATLPTINHDIIRYNAANGIYVNYGSPTISYNQIYNNTGNAVYVNVGSPAFDNNQINNHPSWGLYVLDGSSQVSNNTFTNNGYALRIAGTSSVTNNSFTNSTYRHLVQGPSAAPSYSGNTFTGTGGGAVEVDGGSLSGDITWGDIQGQNWVYVIRANLTIEVGSTLHLPAGKVVKFVDMYTHLYVYGMLDVQGTDTNRVVFTSYKDDLNGGDTNMDGGTTTPGPGDWGTIFIYNSTNTLDYILVQYGGGYFSYGGIYINATWPIIDHSIIRYNIGSGIYVESGSPTISYSQIYNNTNNGVDVNVGSPTVDQNQIYNHPSYGLHVLTGPSQVSNNTFTNNGYAMRLAGTSSVIGNTFTNSTWRHLVQGPSAAPSYSGNTFTGTGGGAVEVDGGSLSGDITWGDIQGQNWVYVVRANLAIEVGSTLHLPAGKVVKFVDMYASLFIYGVLDVQGTDINRVVFTSYKDDLNGGDTNNDGNTTSSAPGDWGTIFIYNHINTLDYALVQYGGGYYGYGGIYVDATLPTIDHNIIRYNAANGIYVNYGSPTISYNQIYNNTGNAVYVNIGSPILDNNQIYNHPSYGLYVLTGSSQVGNNLFTNNGYALRLPGSSIVTNNTFTNSTYRHLVQGPSAAPSYSGNTFTVSGGGAVEVDGGSLSGDITWGDIQGQNWVYVIRANLTIEVGSTLHLPAGKVVKFVDMYASLFIYGVLDVQGTGTNRVVFTSYKDDLNGGDTNMDIGTTTPAPGDWGSIFIYNSANTLDYTLVQYGGGYYGYGGIYVNATLPTIEHNIIRYNYYSGIYVGYGDPLVIYNDIYSNPQYGLYNISPATTRAQHNWWGDASGPYHPYSNPDGLGDTVSDNVDYSNWLTAPANTDVDLSIDEVIPVQVIEGQALVKDKSTAVKVVIHKTGSQPVNYVSVNLNYALINIDQFYVDEQSNYNSVSYALSVTNVTHPLNFASNEITKTIYFIDQRLTPNGTSFQVTVTVDDQGLIPETDESNNIEFTDVIPVIETRWSSIDHPDLYIRYFRVDWDEPPTIFDNYYLQNNEFIKGVYPVAEQYYLPGKTYRVFYTTPFRGPDQRLNQEELTKWISDTMISLNLEAPTADGWMAIVPSGWFSTTTFLGDITGGHFNNTNFQIAEVVRATLSSGYNVAAHELGHLYQLPVGLPTGCQEEYDCLYNPFPHDAYGNYSANGFWVDKRIPMVFSTVGQMRRIHCLMSIFDISGSMEYWIDSQDYFWLLTSHMASPLIDRSMTLDIPQAILAIGTVYPDDNVTLDNWYVLPQAEIDTVSPGPYSFEYQDEGGGVLFSYPFDISFTEEGYTLTEVPFVIRIPYVIGTDKIVVKRNETLLTQKNISPSPPTVDLISPNGGEPVFGSYVIHWSGSDGDGDSLTYVILYSMDNGKNWETLAMDLTGNEYLWDTSKLLSGSQYRIKVIATDGFNTGQDVSDEPFTILRATYLPMVIK